MAIDVIPHDIEKLTRALHKAEVHPLLAEIIIEQHETTVAIQKLINELMTHQSGIIHALPMINQLLKGHGAKLAEIEKKFSDPYKDLIDVDRSN